MPKRAKLPEEIASLQIVFPMTKKKKLKERKNLFRKMKSLIERDKELLPTKDISTEKRTIVLEADEFGSAILFEKPISIQIIISKDREKNKNRVNDLANKLVNYANTILGESARKADVSTNCIFSQKKGINLARKVVEETRLAKINELTKKSLNPKGIMFGYTSDKHENIMIHLYHKERVAILIMSTCKYENTIPWDFTIEEYKNLKECTHIVGQLAQKEF